MQKINSLDHCKVYLIALEDAKNIIQRQIDTMKEHIEIKKKFKNDIK